MITQKTYIKKTILESEIDFKLILLTQFLTTGGINCQPPKPGKRGPETVI